MPGLESTLLFQQEDTNYRFKSKEGHTFGQADIRSRLDWSSVHPARKSARFVVPDKVLGCIIWRWQPRDCVRSIPHVGVPLPLTAAARVPA